MKSKKRDVGKKKEKKDMKKKGTLVRDYLIWIILGIVLLCLVLFVYYIAAGKSFGFLAKIKNLFTFGR